MRFLRHDGIYRSDVSSLLVSSGQGAASRWSGPTQAIGRAGRSTPFPSSAMSSGRLFLDRVGRHQSPSPLHRHPQHNSLAFPHASIYHRTVGSVLTVCLSRGDKRTPYLPDGFAELWQRDRLDLTMESMVVRPPWNTLFTEAVLKVARERLEAHTQPPQP